MAKLLLVDDDAALLEILENYLHRAGDEVRTTTSGAAALTALAEESPDLVVLDVTMPGMDGWQVLARIRERFETPERFFTRFFIANYCPLAFMEASGKNLTPDKLPPDERAPLEAACDRALRLFVQQLKPARVIGVGAFARKRAEKALAGLDVAVGEILHPSPASPKANSGWVRHAEEDLRRLGVAL